MMRETFIERTADVSGGYPCVGDTRIRVALVVEAYWETNDVDAVAERFDLDPEEVRTALGYSEDHWDLIKKDIRRNQLRVMG